MNFGESPLHKIKFTPLMKSLRNLASSKCCLEIVPEISSIQNLNGIELTTNTNFIEYTIPLKYKITLKIHPNEKDDIEDAKTYHSCVDLIGDTPESESCKNLIRMLSDNKMVSRCINKEFFEENKTKLVKVKIDSSTGTNEQVTKILNASTSLQSLNNSNDKSSSSDLDKAAKTAYLNSCDNNLESKLRGSPAFENREKLLDIVRHSSTETEHFDLEKRLTLSSVYSFGTNPESDNDKKKLSFSPISSMSAEKVESPSLVAHKRLVNNPNTMICPVHSVVARPAWNMVKSDFKPKTQIGKLSQYNYYRDRIPPDVKLEYYKQLMEREVRPLIISFNNIMRKCEMLGVHDQLRGAPDTSEDSDLTKRGIEQRHGYDNVEVCNSEPNRVVYNIVFDG